MSKYIEKNLASSNEVRCNNCTWEGEESELDLLKEKPQKGDVEAYFYTGCPDCRTDAYLANIDRREESGDE